MNRPEGAISEEQFNKDINLNLKHEFRMLEVKINQAKKDHDQAEIERLTAEQKEVGEKITQVDPDYVNRLRETQRKQAAEEAEKLTRDLHKPKLN